MRHLRLIGLAFAAFLFTSNLVAQNTGGKIAVNGTVVSEEGEAISGALVRSADGKTTAVTKKDGSFVLEVPAGSTVEITSINREKQQIQVGDAGMNDVKIVLAEDPNVMDDIVVVAYGTQRKKDLTGSVAVVDTKQIDKMITPNIGSALQGLTPGVSVSTSGAPGGSPDIRIRGMNSFSSTGPLYVVDGILLDGHQREFNMNDVESIQILKDAAATTLYGVRGANGVILVTTKKGQSGAAKVNYSSDFGVQQIAKRYDMMQTGDFLKINRMAYENADLTWVGEPTYGQVLNNTDWQEEFYKTGFVQDHNLSVSGGGENSRYMFSFNVYDQDGTVKGPDHRRYSIRSNTESKIGIFTIGETLMLGRSKTHTLIGNPFIDLARMPPVISVYDKNNESGYGYGSIAYPTYGTNPIAMQELNNTTQSSNRFIGNAYAAVKPIKGLEIKTSLGLEYHNWYDKEISIYKQDRYLTPPTEKNKLLERKGAFNTLTWENTISYGTKIGKHKFDALFGQTLQRRSWDSNEASGFNLTEGYWVLGQVTKDTKVDGTRSVRTMTGLLGRINYDYDGRYLVQLNIRRDGSSAFGSNYKYGTFGSGSIGWRISEEAFFKGARKYVDELKLRASYGTIGDQQAIPNYTYAAIMVTGEGGIFGNDKTYYPGAIQKGRSNPDTKWETRETFNIGFDFAALKQRLYGSVEFYNSNAKDLLISAEMAWVDGTDISPWLNVGRLNNRGFEVMLGYREHSNAFTYDVAFNFSTLRNRVKQLDKPYRLGGLNGVTRTEVGHSIGEFWLLQTDGIFQNMDEVYAHTATVKNPVTGLDEQVLIQPNATAGDIRYKDTDGDGRISEKDRVFAGRSIPNFEAGLNVTLGYKNFDFNLFFSGAFGHSIYNSTKFSLESMNETSNYPKNLKPWSSTNPSNTTPRPVIGSNDNILTYTDRWLEKGDYVKLRNIQLGYSFPEKLLHKTGFISKARIYVGAQNLFTITNYSGLDPEISGGGVLGKNIDNGSYPPVRTFSGGIQITF